MYSDELLAQTTAVKEIKDTVIEADRKFNSQDQEFFQNNNVVDLSLINQRNEYLMEMMKILMVIKFLVTNDDHSFQGFLSQLKDQTSVFKKQLNKMFNLLNSRIDLGSDPGPLQASITNGMINISDFANLFKKYGLDINPVQYDNNPVINNLSYSNIVSALLMKFPSIIDVAQQMKKLRSASVITPADVGNVTVVYNKLYSFYADIRI